MNSYKNTIPPVGEIPGEKLKYWIYGKGGSGKTARAISLALEWSGNNPKEIYKADLLTEGWCDGYSGQKVVIIDDYKWDGSHKTFRELLKLLDRYYAAVNVKSSSSIFQATHVVVVSQDPPWDIWSPQWHMQFNKKKLNLEMIDSNEQLRQVWRRLNRIEHLDVPLSQLTHPFLMNVNIKTDLK